MHCEVVLVRSTVLVFVCLGLLSSLAITAYGLVEAHAIEDRIRPVRIALNVADRADCSPERTAENVVRPISAQSISAQAFSAQADSAQTKIPLQSEPSARLDRNQIDPTQIDPARLGRKKYLPAIARAALALHFGHSNRHYQSLEEFANSFPVPESCQKNAAIFVTLSKNGKTRACWGSINPQYPDLVKGTVYATEAALAKEYRFGRVQPKEWNTLKPQVTIIKSIQPIDSIRGQNALAFGLLVRSGGRGAILLPGEASDAYYQMIQCKIKAGLDPHKPCQMYRVIADVCN